MTLLKVPVIVFAVAVIGVVALLFSTLHFGPLTFNGQPLGFQDTTWRVKGWQPTEVITADQRKNPVVKLPVKADEGFCFITSASGAFWGNGQIVSITQSNGELFLNAKSDRADAGLIATAQCVRFSEHALTNTQAAK